MEEQHTPTEQRIIDGYGVIYDSASIIDLYRRQDAQRVAAQATTEGSAA